VTETRQQVLAFPVAPSLAREDFLVVPENAAAVAWVDRWPDWPAPALILHGPAGSGKSHLASAWQGRSGARAATGAALTPASVPTLLPPHGALVIDHAEDVGGCPHTERALLHLLNRARDERGFLLLLGRSAPARWPVALADLRSRLLAVPSTALPPPGDALLAALLVKLFADRQLRVDNDIIQWLVARIERSFAAAQTAVDTLDRAALSAGRRLTVALARLVLEQGERAGGGDDAQE